MRKPVKVESSGVMVKPPVLITECDLSSVYPNTEFKDYQIYFEKEIAKLFGTEPITNDRQAILDMLTSYLSETIKQSTWSILQHNFLPKQSSPFEDHTHSFLPQNPNDIDTQTCGYIPSITGEPVFFTAVNNC